MKVKIWGCRGSIAVSSPDTVKAGGNTTCIEVKSDCLPAGMKLIVDAGTGFVPAGYQYLSEIGNGNLNYHIFFSHYHWDHILGLTLSPPTFIDCIPMTMYGPIDTSFQVKDVIEYIFRRPFFPVDSTRIRSKMTFRPLEDFDVTVIAIHPEGGVRVMAQDLYLKMLSKGQIFFKATKKHQAESECMIITMQPTNHSNSRCISYRFEEKPTGKVFVFCTDHEDEAALAADFKRHMSGADLLIIDAQYNRDKYEQQTARFGHGTPGGVVRLAQACGIKRVGLTHHDPRSSDKFLEETMLDEARASINPETVRTGEEVPLNVFLCRDYEEHEA